MGCGFIVRQESRIILPQNTKMFGSPSRITNKSGDTVYYLDVNTSSLGVEIEYTSDGLIYNKEVQPRFRSLQSLVISELANEKQLFDGE